MQLEAMWVHGLRRLGGPIPIKLRLDSPLVCLIGANEVGKSTLLDALELGYIEPSVDPGEVPPVVALDRTRSESVPDEQEIVRLRYRLDKADLDALTTLHGAPQLTGVRFLERKKSAGGSMTTALSPPPVRDKTPRSGLASALSEAITTPGWPDAEEAQETPADEATMSGLIEQLGSNNYRIDANTLDQLLALASFLGEDRDPDLAQRIREVVEIERLPHPYEEALAVLSQRVPRFLRFDDTVRNLADEYDLAAVAENPPRPLYNIAQLAALDLRLLVEKITIGETGTVKDLLDQANETLRERFEAWTQQPSVTVSLDHSNTQLFIHVKSGTGTTMRIGERSDGLRQFVALVALTAYQGYTVPPILLIDEVEMHLHYDAQADLIAVLETQTTASQVIYTTHSAAALPEDLGSAVRVVHGVGDTMMSTIEQQFWSDSPGLGALLLAMGAGSLAFVALRPAVIVEGGGDLILLPSLLKEAIGERVLGFQVVPGAANVPPKRVAGLDLQGVVTVWILDGDSGGEARRRFLIEQGVDASRILLLEAGGEPLDLEDLIDAAAYAAAVTAYAQDVGGAQDFTVAELPSERCARHRTVVAWFERNALRVPSKTAIANKVVELRGDMRLVDPQRRTTLQKVHRQARTLLDT